MGYSYLVTYPIMNRRDAVLSFWYYRGYREDDAILQRLHPWWKPGIFIHLKGVRVKQFCFNWFSAEKWRLKVSFDSSV